MPQATADCVLARIASKYVPVTDEVMLTCRCKAELSNAYDTGRILNHVSTPPPPPRGPWCVWGTEVWSSETQVRTGFRVFDAKMTQEILKPKHGGSWARRPLYRGPCANVTLQHSLRHFVHSFTHSLRSLAIYDNSNA